MKKFILTILIILLSGAITDNYGKSRKKKREKRRKIEYVIDTIYVIDTVHRYVTRINKDNKLFNIASIDTYKLNEIDSLVNVLYATNYLENINSFTKVSLLDDGKEFDSKIVDIDDDELRERFEKMYTEIDLPYHPMLKGFISKYIDNKHSMNILLGRALYYMPIFERELIKNEMPLELKLLPVVESSLIPTAKSNMGAGGLWQFMPYTAKMYGLKITSLIDERFDPIKSTQAACRFLKDLYRIYDDWTLAVAAYNCGPGNVNKAIARAGGAKNYWDIYPYLPRQTRDYVPAFIAANYAFTFYKSHDITFDKVPEIVVTDTIRIENNVMDLRQISSTLDISERTIKFFNPQFKGWIVPAVSKSYVIYLPQDLVLDYVKNESEILAKSSTYLPKKITAEYLNKLEIKPRIHIVRSGDVLGAISRRYKVSIKKLVQLNKLSAPNSLKIGQRIRLA